MVELLNMLTLYINKQFGAIQIDVCFASTVNNAIFVANFKRCVFQAILLDDCTIFVNINAFQI